MKILIALTGEKEHLGDNVMKSVILEAARFNFPRARIAVYAKFPEVFRFNRFADEVVGAARFKTIRQARAVFLRRKFDLVIDAGSYPGQIFLAAAREAGIKTIDGSPQAFRGRLRKIFNVPPPPFTDGDIPLAVPKTDEFLLSLKEQGLKIPRRFFPAVFCSAGAYKKVVRRLEKKGFDFSRPAYVLCESASGAVREWGTANFTRLAKRLCGRGFQVIVNVLKKSEKEALEPYFRAGIKKKSLFFLETSLGEYFALLGLNNYFFRNVIGGAVAGDTGALHAAQAANSRLSGFLRPAVICLGHDRTSGDIRYADPGITYLARLKSGWDRRLEKAAADKMKLFRRKEFSKFIGMPIRYVSVDEPAKNPYLVRGVPARPDVLPVFIGRQVYCHTLLRNIFKDEIRPLAAAERKRFYRRMDVKKIGPEFVARLFEEMESQKAEEAAKNAPKAGAVMTAEGKDETRRLETTYRALLFLEKSGSRMFPRPAYFSGFGDRDVLVSSRLGGGRLLDSWKSMNRAGKMRILKQVMEQLKIIHKIKFGNFGKFGINSSLLFASWEDYIKSCINQRLVEIKRKRRLDSGDLFRLKEFVRRNSAFLRSSGASLVHHDIKADNILVSRGKLSGLIDFEYSTAAPIDYEADTLLRSFADPEIYFGRRGKFLKSDAELVWKAARRYYPEIFDFRGIGARLKMYNIKFYLDLLARGKRPGHCRLKLEEQLSGKGILKNPG